MPSSTNFRAPVSLARRRPPNMERFIERAAQRGADAIQLDLEDSVAPAEKSAARATIAATAARLAHEGATVLVRINRPLTLAILDLEASLSPHVTGVILPKVSGPEHIRLIAEAIGELERLRGMPVGSTRLVALIETAEAALRIAEIGAADPRLVAITLGTEDLSADLGCSPDSPVFETLSAQLVVAARAANVLPLGLVGSIAGIDDLESFRLVARRSRAFGLAGASCVHPSQVPILNEEFSPTGRELERAQ